MTTVNTTPFAKTPQAGDDTYAFTEAGLQAAISGVPNILIMDVMANDLGGKAKTLFSVDDGGSSLTDILSGLVNSDVGKTTAGTTQSGAVLKIVDGKVQIDLTLAFANTPYKSLDQMGAGDTFTDSFTYAIRLGNGTLSWATVNYTITGTNDAPVVSGAVTATAAEDGGLFTLNALANASDVDAGTTLQVVDVQADLPAGVTYNADAKTFTLDSSNAAFQSLAAGSSTTVTVNYAVTDGLSAPVAASVTWTVSGTNDKPVVTNSAEAATGTVVEAGHADDGTATVGTAAAMGTLSASDVDAGSSWSWSILDTTPDTTYGTFAVNAQTGLWTYTLDNSLDATQALNEGDSIPLSYTVRVTDDTGAYADQTVTVTVTGSNDKPVVSGPLSGTATEDAGASTLNALANASDVDAGTTLQVVDVQADLPAGVTYNADAKTFTLDSSNAVFQSLAAGSSTTVTVDYAVTDGLSTPVTTSATWTVTGTNDVPVVSGAVTGTAAEDGGLVTLNALENASDVDAGATLSVVDVQADLPAGVNYDGLTKSFTLDPTNAAYQSLAAGATDTVTVNYGVSDGIETTLTSASWLVTGVNDVAVFGGDTAGSVTEDGTLKAQGVLTVSDVDTGESSFTNTGNLVGTYGTFKFDITTGAWEYLLNNPAANVQALAAGQEPVDSLRVTSKDGSTQDIVVQINGANEPVSTAVAQRDVVYVSNGTQDIVIPVSALLANDVAASGATFTLGTASGTSSMTDLRYNPGPSGGTVSFNYEGFGTESGFFTYSLDGGLTTATVEVRAKNVDNGNKIDGIILEGDYAASYFDLDNGNDSAVSSGAVGIDHFIGGKGADSLSGGAGADRLEGGEANDTLTGGAGSDTFVFNTNLNSSGTDTISDFNANNASADRDFIELSLSLFSGVNAPTDAAGTLSSSQFASVPGLASYTGMTAVKIVYDQSTGNLYYDSNGSAAGFPSESFATLANKPTDLDASDFKLV